MQLQNDNAAAEPRDMAIPSPMIFLRSVCSAMNEKSRKIFSTLMSMQRLYFYIDSDFDIDIGKVSKSTLL